MTKLISLFFPLSILFLCLVFTDVNNLLLSQKRQERSATSQGGKAIFMSLLQDAPFTPEQLEKAKSIIAKVSSEDKAEVKAKTKYSMFCAPCHGPNGDMEMNGAKALSKSVFSLEESVARIYHGGGMMTAFEELMTEAEIVAVAEYIENRFKD